jgi:hypothetical protein
LNRNHHGDGPLQTADLSVERHYRASRDDLTQWRRNPAIDLFLRNGQQRRDDEMANPRKENFLAKGEFFATGGSQVTSFSGCLGGIFLSERVGVQQLAANLSPEPS